MQIQITGRHMELGEALRGRIEEGLEAAVSKYFSRTGDANVFVSQQGPFVEVDCNVHLLSGIVLQSSGKANDPYAALEVSLEKMEKRVRRYKRRLKDHHTNGQPLLPAEMAAEILIQATDDEAEDSVDTGMEIGEAPPHGCRNQGPDPDNERFRGSHAAGIAGCPGTHVQKC